MLQLKNLALHHRTVNVTTIQRWFLFTALPPADIIYPHMMHNRINPKCFTNLHSFSQHKYYTKINHRKKKTPLNTTTGILLLLVGINDHQVSATQALNIKPHSLEALPDHSADHTASAVTHNWHNTRANSALLFYPTLALIFKCNLKYVHKQFTISYQQRNI